jgi:hypothetical protein
MKGEAMQRICCRLEDNGIAMSRLRALEFFAREGDWQTVSYAGRVASVEAWEIDHSFEAGLRRNLPHAKVRIVDSYVYGNETQDRFDFVVLDNPQAVFGPNVCYCEHFEALPVALRLLAPAAVLVFNLNWAPFNFHGQADWQSRRAEFYEIGDTSSLSVERFLLPFYDRYFRARGFQVKQRFSELRNNEYLAYAVYYLTRI